MNIIKISPVITILIALLVSFCAGCHRDGSAENSSGSSSGPIMAPSNLQASTQIVLGIYSIHLAWENNADNEDGFLISIKQGAGGYNTDIFQVKADQNTCDVTWPSGQLYFKVRAFNKTGVSNFSNEAFLVYYPGQ